ncbi:hypothetical protein [Klebsiella pneumoniae IS39]|nr:hypothetical protein [Klebsiella pneumoniae IS39]
MLLLGLNSFITNVIGLVIKKKTRYIIGMTTGIKKPKPLMIPSPHSELLIF